jgi:hypothetical protein
MSKSVILTNAVDGCPACVTHSSRRPRSVVEKLFAKEAWKCGKCGRRWYIYRSVPLVLEHYARCPLCHSADLTILAKRDKLDRMSPNPLRRLLALFGFPLYYCNLSRYQFYDWRDLDPACKKSGNNPQDPQPQAPLRAG